MKALVLTLAVLLSGCSTMTFLDNRVTCTVAKDEAHFISKWGPVGLASKIAEQDTKILCK